MLCKTILWIKKEALMHLASRICNKIIMLIIRRMIMWMVGRMDKV